MNAKIYDMKPIFTFLLALLSIPMFAQTASLQIVHNSPSGVVDIWVNGQKLIENFEYRTATPFFNAPAGVVLDIGVAPAPSSAPDESVFNYSATLDSGELYVAIANGLIGSAEKPFSIELIVPARTEATDPGNVDLAVFHGSPDAPNVDVLARGEALLVEDLGFGETWDYLELPAENYLLDIRPTGSQDVALSYFAPIAAIAGEAGVVIATGYLDPEPDQPEFALIVVFPNGGIAELPQIGTARLQIIHNSPEPMVDVWVNGQKAIEDFTFRSATPFLTAEFLVGEPMEVGVAPSTSTDPSEILATFDVLLENGEDHIVIANGVLNNPMTPFNLQVIGNARTSAASQGEVDVMVFHGSPDAPDVDVLADGALPPLVDDLAFSENTDYLSLPVGAYDLSVTPADDNNTLVATYRADISGLGGGAAFVFASGFLQSSPDFGLWVALPDGTVFPLPLVTSANDRRLDAEVQLYPNPVTDFVTVTTTLEEPAERLDYTVVDMQGKVLRQVEELDGGNYFESRIELSDLSNGHYILLIRNQNNETVQLPFSIQK